MFLKRPQKFPNLYLTFTNVKTSGRFFSNFVALSQCLNSEIQFNCLGSTKTCEKPAFYLKSKETVNIPQNEKNKTNINPNMHELIVIPKIPLEKSKMEIIGVIAM